MYLKTRFQSTALEASHAKLTENVKESRVAILLILSVDIEWATCLQLQMWYFDLPRRRSTIINVMYIFLMNSPKDSSSRKLAAN